MKTSKSGKKGKSKLGKERTALVPSQASDPALANAVKTDKYSQHILEALELPDFEIDFSLNADADQETPDKAVV